MSTVRRTLELDADTDARLEYLTAERGQDAAGVGADAIALLVSTVEIIRDRAQAEGERSRGSFTPASRE